MTKVDKLLKVKLEASSQDLAVLSVIILGRDAQPLLCKAMTS